MVAIRQPDMGRRLVVKLCTRAAEKICPVCTSVSIVFVVVWGWITGEGNASDIIKNGDWLNDGSSGRLTTNGKDVFPNGRFIQTSQNVPNQSSEPTLRGQHFYAPQLGSRGKRPADCVHRSPSRHRFYEIDKVKKVFGIIEDIPQVLIRCVVYCRCSPRNKKAI